MPIRSWSHSRLADFEQCNFKAYLKYDQRIPEPERPLPPGKTEHANDRGTRVHEAAEQYVRGTALLIPELNHFAHEFEALRTLYSEGRVSLEGEWGMNQDWEPCDWRQAWLRLKLDSLVHVSRTEAIVIDYKTGKKFGNEIKHAEQIQLYTLSTFLRYPELETVTTELWYTDQDDLTSITYRRDQGLRFRENFTRRATKMTTAEEFRPNPNIFSCKYCPYGPWGTGHCEKGVKR